MAWATLVWAPGAMLLAWWIYKVDPSWSRAKAFVARFPNLFRWVNAKYYVDEFYDAALIEPIKRFSAQLWSFDTWVVDGMVNGAARATLIWAELSNWMDEYLVDGAVDLVEYFVQETSGVFRGLQSGRVGTTMPTTRSGNIMVILTTARCSTRPSVTGGWRWASRRLPAAIFINSFTVAPFRSCRRWSLPTRRPARRWRWGARPRSMWV